MRRGLNGSVQNVEQDESSGESFEILQKQKSVEINLLNQSQHGNMRVDRCPVKPEQKD